MTRGRSWVIVVAMVTLGASGCGATGTRRASPSEPPEARKRARPEVVVRAQTADEAFDWLWRQLDDMPFFRQHHYDVALPSHPLFQGLANEGLTGKDKAAARRVFLAEVYDARAFATGHAVIEKLLVDLDPELETFRRWSSRWGFASAPRYEVILTLYGPGGSYDPDAATITVVTTPDGRFKKEPLHTLVHEMVHIGIEGPIVRRFALTHPEKERLVDRICLVAFGDRLSGYRLQPMGPPALDRFIDAVALDDLPAAIGRYRARANDDPSEAASASGASATGNAP
jgi:hypothetical protein